MTNNYTCPYILKTVVLGTDESRDDVNIVLLVTRTLSHRTECVRNLLIERLMRTHDKNTMIKYINRGKRG